MYDLKSLLSRLQKNKLKSAFTSDDTGKRSTIADQEQCLQCSIYDDLQSLRWGSVRWNEHVTFLTEILELPSWVFLLTSGSVWGKSRFFQKVWLK